MFLTSEKINDLKNDAVAVIVTSVFAQLARNFVTQVPLGNMPDSLLNTITLTIIGFSFFTLVVKGNIVFTHNNPEAQIAIDHVLKFGSMFLMKKLVEVYLLNQPQINLEWVQQTAIALGSFALYRFTLHQVIPKKINYYREVEKAAAILGMTVITNLLSGRGLSINWVDSLYDIIGWSIYFMYFS